MRLDKYLAERTGMTRSESRRAVTKGRVMIDGAVCRKADTQLTSTPLPWRWTVYRLAGAYRKYVYIVLNKPGGRRQRQPRQRRIRRWSIWWRRTSPAGVVPAAGGWTRRAPALCC